MSGRRVAAAPTVGEQLRRASDRLVTPGVVITALVIGGVVVVATAAAAVWVELAGGDGLVVIDTVTKTLAALGSLAATALLAVARHQLSRIEVSAAAAAAPVSGGPPTPQATERTAATPRLPPTPDSPSATPAAPHVDVDPLEPEVDHPAPAVTPASTTATLDETGLIPVVRQR